MEKWYKKAIDMSNPNEYEASVRVDISSPADYDVEASLWPKSTVSIRFQIEMEARSWGIKGVYLSVPEQIITIPSVVTRWDEQHNPHEQDRDIVVDVSKIRKEETKGRGVITLGTLDLYLDANLNVDYGSSTLEVLYL